LPERRPVLDELETRAPSERGIAAVAAAVGGIARRIADPDPFARGHALKSWRRLGAHHPQAVLHV